MTKSCYVCKLHKDLCEFHKNKSSRDGLVGICKACAKVKRQVYYLNNKPKAISSSASWKQANPEKTKISRLKWRLNNEELDKLSKIRYADNNREKNRLRKAKDYLEHKDEYKIYKHTRRAKEHSSPNDKYSGSDIAFMYENQFGLCAYCLVKIDSWPSKKTHIEHIDSLSLGGSNSIDNIVLSCSKCNLRKADKSLIQFLMYDKRLNLIRNNKKGVVINGS